MKSRLPALILLFFLAFVLSACSIQDLPLISDYIDGGTSTGSTPVTLTMWGLWEDPQVMAALIQKYQVEHPNVTINYEDRSVMKPLVDYKERVYTRLGASDGPDIIRVHNTWVKSMASKLVPAPNNVMTADAYKTAFYPVAVDSAVINDNVYAMPTYYDGLVLLYNKDHFRSVGQEAPPTAWEEFRRLALDLSIWSGDNELVRAGAAMGNASNIEHFSDILGMMFSQAGVRIPADLDKEAAQHALMFYTNFIKEDKIWSTSFPEATDAFANGQVSMIFAPVWRIIDIKKASPQLNFGVASVPQAVSAQPASWASFWMDAVSTSCEHPKVAWDFINFLASDEQQLYMYNEYARARGVTVPYSKASLNADLQLDTILKPVITDAPYAKSAEIAARAGNRRQETALKDAVEAVLRGDDPSLALTTAKGIISQ